MMEPILGAFEERLRGVAFNPPRIPYLSNVTGTWIKTEEATDPAYWARHIRSTVRFRDNLAELFRKPEQILIEAGPGNVLTTLARQQGGAGGAGLPVAAASARDDIPRCAARCKPSASSGLWASMSIGPNFTRPDSVAARSAAHLSFRAPEVLDRAGQGAAMRPSGTAQPQPPPARCDGISFYTPRLEARCRLPQPPPPRPAPGSSSATRSAWPTKSLLNSKPQSRKSSSSTPARSYKQIEKAAAPSAPLSAPTTMPCSPIFSRAAARRGKIVHLWSVAARQTPEPPLEETLDRSFL